MPQKTHGGGPPGFDLERRQLAPQLRDRQRGLRRHQRPHFIFMRSQRVPLMAAKLSRQTTAGYLKPPQELDHVARTDSKAAGRLASGLACRHSPHQAAT
ncbi:MAG: hypothetical protein WBE80_04930 [Methylocella sp.]